jgi:hypothetical protein
MQITCDNPNGYDIVMSASTKDHSIAYVGDSRKAVKSVLELPKTTLPRQGSGALNASITITATKSELVALTPTLLGANPIPFEMTLTIGVDVDVSFFLKRWRVSQNFIRDCGLSMQGITQLALGLPGGKMSSLVCADSFEKLVIPSAGELESFEHGIRLSASEIKPDAVAEGTVAKNLGLGVIMGVCYTAFLTLVFVSVRVFLGRCCCSDLVGLGAAAARNEELTSAGRTSKYREPCPSESSSYSRESALSAIPEGSDDAASRV